MVCPEHTVPPQLAKGWLHARVAVRVAGPQLEDHNPHDHDDQPPLMATKKAIIIIIKKERMKNIKEGGVKS